VREKKKKFYPQIQGVTPRAFPREWEAEGANSDDSLQGQTLSLEACNPYYEHPGAR
jgi:hypothetical protein